MRSATATLQLIRAALHAPQAGVYQVIYLNRTAEDAYRPLAAYKPFVPFRDASCGVSTFHLTVYDCIKVCVGKRTTPPP